MLLAGSPKFHQKSPETNDEATDYSNTQAAECVPIFRVLDYPPIDQRSRFMRNLVPGEVQSSRILNEGRRNRRPICKSCIFPDTDRDNDKKIHPRFPLLQLSPKPHVRHSFHSTIPNCNGPATRPFVRPLPFIPAKDRLASSIMHVPANM